MASPACFQPVPFPSRRCRANDDLFPCRIALDGGDLRRHWDCAHYGCKRANRLRCGVSEDNSGVPAAPAMKMNAVGSFQLSSVGSCWAKLAATELHPKPAHRNSENHFGASGRSACRGSKRGQDRVPVCAPARCGSLHPRELARLCGGYPVRRRDRQGPTIRSTAALQTDFGPNTRAEMPRVSRG